MEIDNLVRVHVPAGWEVQTSDTPGLEVYVLTLVPEGTEPQALMPGNERVDFAYLTLSNLGRDQGSGGVRFGAAGRRCRQHGVLFRDRRDRDH